MDSTAPKQLCSSHPFMCAVCNKSYARIDHLARHSRQHTQERPFRCSECGKCFGRADLLKRHARLHTPEAAAKRREKEATKGKTRVSQACANCAAAKIKCTQEKPCKRCDAQGLVCELAFQTYANHNVSPTVSTTSTPSSLSGSHPVSPHTPSAGETAAARGENAPALDVTEGCLQENQASVGSSGLLRWAVQEQLPLEHVDFSQANQATIADDRNPIPLDVLREFPQHTEINDTDRTMAERDSNYHHYYPERSSIRFEPFSPTNPSGFNIGPQPAVTFQSFQLDGQGTEPFWGYHTALVADSHPPPLVQAEVPQPQIGVSNDGPIGQYEDVQEPTALVTVEDDENTHLSINQHNTQSNAIEQDLSQDGQNLKPSQRLLPASRDRIIGLLASVCSREKFQEIVISLYSVEILNELLENFIESAGRSIDSWTHLASLDFHTIQPELLTMLVASGAIMSSKRDIQNLGYVMEEACRLAILKKVRHGFLELEHTRKDSVSAQSTLEQSSVGVGAQNSDWYNLAVQNLQFLQAYALQLNAGMWSGYHNKIKNSEAEVLSLITTLRRLGLLRLHKVPPRCEPSFRDSPDTLNRKWLSWIEHESLKRLVYHIHLHSSRVSISLQTPPLISYAELALEFPVPVDIWLAPTADAWRDLFTIYSREVNDSCPKFGSCIFDMREIMSYSAHVDFDFVLHVILCSYWALIWDYRQFITVANTSSWSEERIDSSAKSPSLLSEQRIESLLESFQSTLAEKHVSLLTETRMLYQLLNANLHAPFQCFQLLAGMHGGNEARRAYPLVKRWYGTRRSRQSIWHAGQLLRATTAVAPMTATVSSTTQSSSSSSISPPSFRPQDYDLRETGGRVAGTGKLRGFEVIAVYNAWLVLWAYGLMARARQQECQQINSVISHISFGSSMNPSPAAVTPDIWHQCEHNDQSTTRADDKWIYLDGDALVNKDRRDEFTIKNRGWPVIQSDLPSWVQNKPKRTSELEASRRTAQPGGCTETIPSNMLNSPLMNDRATNKQADKNEVSLGRSESLTGVPLHEASRVVQVVIELIKTLATMPKREDERSERESRSEMPFLAESLTRLMEHLGRATDEINV
ncbi:uncharacterized protein N7496_002489 [Penicillium cataractarum]|uniref:Uncharacterized protein n=1 Tax=Penicillium cataractarum TaxID=2100454 RepID=A0A9W9SK52_9EURO|nr:uncharacterized protein N7496_002489 [Penicillium cataractarum]KAJ5380061.1 hypothetical protein N7496_002489 [Penicillium cataractarum]